MIKTKHLIIFFFIQQIMTAQNILFDLKTSKNIQNWSVVDDRVMGGVSRGNITIHEEGFMVFSGIVSTDNYGGFSSVRANFEAVNVSKSKAIKIRLKGDGKTYQFRIKPQESTYYAYVKSFKTTNDWETIEIKLSEMEASFRGRKLNIPNFNHDTISELAILIGNKTKERFELKIESILLE